MVCVVCWVSLGEALYLPKELQLTLSRISELMSGNDGCM